MLRACRLSSAYLPDERLSWAATFSLTPGYATVRRSGLPGSAVRSAVALEGYGVSRESALQHLRSEGEITQGYPPDRKLMVPYRLHESGLRPRPTQEIDAEPLADAGRRGLAPVQDLIGLSRAADVARTSVDQVAYRQGNGLHGEERDGAQDGRVRVPRWPSRNQRASQG